MKLERILVATDFSAHSGAALAAAIDLARQTGAGIALVHAFRVPSYSLPAGPMPVTASVFADLLADANAALDEQRRLVERSGVPVLASECLLGMPSPEILEYAREHGTDLIVVGTHGRTGVARALLGSVAEEVVRRAPCPVLTVPLRALEKRDRSPGEATRS